MTGDEILTRFIAELEADEDTAMLPTMLEPYRLMLSNSDGVVATLDKIFDCWRRARV